MTSPTSHFQCVQRPAFFRNALGYIKLGGDIKESVDKAVKEVEDLHDKIPNRFKEKLLDQIRSYLDSSVCPRKYANRPDIPVDLSRWV